jgi:hypothetical protein
VLLRALETTGQLIDGATAADSLRAAIDDLYDQVLRELDRTSDYDRISAISAGSAAIRAGAEALGEQSLGRGIPDEETDPESWTSAFHASIAISGGAIWDHAGDPDRRRALWQWWLHEAHRLLGAGDSPPSRSDQDGHSARLATNSSKVSAIRRGSRSSST